MNKKAVLGICLAGVLAFGTGVGTTARYVSTFKSNQNQISAANWKLASEGISQVNTISEVGSKFFDISKFAPGANGNFDFKIDKKGTEVPVEYFVKLEKSGDLFEKIGAVDSPINFRLIMNGQIYYFDENGIAHIEADKTMEKDFFTLNYSWTFENSTGTDNYFAGKDGSVNLTVTAQQVDERQNVKFAALYIRDKDASTPQYSQTTARVVFEGNNIVELTGEDSYLGKIEYKDGKFTSGLDGWNTGVFYAGLNDNGKYVFKNSSQNKHIEVSLYENLANYKTVKSTVVIREDNKVINPNNTNLIVELDKQDKETIIKVLDGQYVIKKSENANWTINGVDAVMYVSNANPEILMYQCQNPDTEKYTIVQIHTQRIDSVIVEDYLK